MFAALCGEMLGADSGFCTEEWGEWVACSPGVYPEVTGSVGHVAKLLQFENWNLIENCFTSNINDATK